MNANPQRSTCRTWACSWSRQNRQAPGVAADDHVAQGHRGETDPVGEPPRQAAVKLERAAAALDPPARAEGEHAGDQPTSVVGAAQVYSNSRMSRRLLIAADWTTRNPFIRRCAPIERRATAPWQSGAPLGYLTNNSASCSSFPPRAVANDSLRRPSA